jgi:hypothetical protein
MLCLTFLTNRRFIKRSDGGRGDEKLKQTVAIVHKWRVFKIQGTAGSRDYWSGFPSSLRHIVSVIVVVYGY